MNNVNMKYDYLVSNRDKLIDMNKEELDSILKINGIHRFFYKSVYDSKVIEGIDSIINSLRDITINTYIANYNATPLINMGISKKDVTKAIDEYRKDVDDEITRIRAEYKTEIKELRMALGVRYNEVKEDNNDLSYDEVAKYVDFSYTVKHEYKVSIPNKHIIYTSYFYYFVVGREGYMFSRSKLKSIVVGLNIYRRDKIRRVFTVLGYIVGVNAARDITHVSIGGNIELPKKCSMYSTKVNSRINKELKKYIYKSYYNMFKEYYVNKKYEGKIDYKYLRKYGYEI